MKFNVVRRIPKWTTFDDDGGAVDVQYADEVSDCLHLTVDRIPCIVTLSKVLFNFIVCLLYACMHQITEIL